MRISKVYTRTGDAGETGLGGGQRVQKDASRIATYGTVDELSSWVGVCLAEKPEAALEVSLMRIQNELFHLGSDLCLLEEDKKDRAIPQIEKRHVDALEADIDRLNAELEPLRDFVLPGGSRCAAWLHVTRTVCRRAERCVTRLAREEEIGSYCLPYLNRLSDLLFVLARYYNKSQAIPEPLWNKDG